MWSVGLHLPRRTCLPSLDNNFRVVDAALLRFDRPLKKLFWRQWGMYREYRFCPYCFLSISTALRRRRLEWALTSLLSWSTRVKRLRVVFPKLRAWRIREVVRFLFFDHQYYAPTRAIPSLPNTYGSCAPTARRIISSCWKSNFAVLAKSSASNCAQSTLLGSAPKCFSTTWWQKNFLDLSASSSPFISMDKISDGRVISSNKIDLSFLTC